VPTRERTGGHEVLVKSNIFFIPKSKQISITEKVPKLTGQ
jgi:hypothetical protein